MEFANIKFDKDGLIPVIAQDVHSGAVLMLAWMNEEALRATLETGRATYYSRSRQRLWVKGETSGNVQQVKGLRYDCDGDALLMQVEQTGAACHTGAYSCFHNALMEGAGYTGGMMQELYGVILDRKSNPREGSHTNYLFEKGVDKICKKVGEEASEVIIAAKNSSQTELRYEAADLIYHLLVLMADQGLTPADVMGELAARR